MNFEQVFNVLNILNEDIDFGEKELKSRSFKLKHGLVYTSVEVVLAGDEPLNKIYPALDEETLLKYYSDGGFIEANDTVVFPKGTAFDFKEYIDYNGNAYFILAVTNNPNCLVAISTEDILDLFDR